MCFRSFIHYFFSYVIQALLVVTVTERRCADTIAFNTVCLEVVHRVRISAVSDTGLTPLRLLLYA